MGVETENDDPDVYQRNARGGAQVIQIDSSKHVNAVTFCAIVCGASVVLAAWAAMVARDATTEYRVLLNHTMELENSQKVMAAQLERLNEQR